ncbi:glycosyltransferase [uncultured Tateyamaria sp.]|uniref:glycosyltransferase n=1 Tax=uncultured Tateyamaria sp. TaxID=455651 RepID=UPI002623E714|nr:glycosyltransferase [uncultured Tateyamaria sp.]
MHIAHVLTRLLRAGSEENTLATCRWQVAAGHRVSLIHGNMCDPFWHDHLPRGVTRIAVPEMVHPIRPVQDARAVTRLRALYRDLRPDVIHTHQSKAGVLGRLAADAVPDAVVAHGIHIIPFEGVGDPKRALYVAAERMVARRTDVFIAVSEAVGCAYVEAGITGQVHCVRSGMDLARFRDAPLPADWPAVLGVAPGAARPPVALMMAAFEPRKRHVPFLRAFARAVDVLPDMKLLLAGRGPEEARVRAEVAALGLGDRVVFCGHRPDPEALFALADVSILTSEREGLPRVVVQSIAAGCPPVVQHLPGLDEVVVDGRNGVIAAPDNMDATVRALREVLASPKQLAALRRGARATDLSAWALDRLGARTTALYQAPAALSEVA